MSRKFEQFFPIVIITIEILTVFLSMNYLSPKKYFNQDFVFGKVTEIVSEKTDDDPYVPGRKLGKQELEVLILSGEYKGQTFYIQNTLSKGHNILTEEGKSYIFSIREESEIKTVVWLYSYNRIPILSVLLILFISLVVIIAGKKGVRSLIALSFTGILILFVLVPLILKGFDPVLLSITLLILITTVNFLLISGFNKKSIVAITGTLGGIISAAFISYITAKIAHLSGINMEKGEQILYIAEDYGIKINGFLFIAILIASSGAVMDVAMSITSALTEIRVHKPQIHNRDLFKSGMSIGHDLIGTMINTLILAFTGGSFTLILMIYGLAMKFNQFINIPIISIEIIQALSGSIGILLTVPITNIFFIFIYKRRRK